MTPSLRLPIRVLKDALMDERTQMRIVQRHREMLPCLEPQCWCKSYARHAPENIASLKRAIEILEESK